MSEHQLLVANLVRTAILLIFIGLLVKRRAHLCWSFTIYLAAIVTGNTLISFWPERFYTQSFYILKETVYNILMLCVATELAYRVFRAFPGALSRARVVLAPLLALIAIAIISVPTGTDYRDIVTRYHPQVQTGLIWVFSATAVLAVWYNIPLHRLHRALLLGFTSNLIVFATLYNILRSFGWQRLYDPIARLDTYAYLALVAWWAFTAWRSNETFEVGPFRSPVPASPAPASPAPALSPKLA
jgi:hypothetical protein